MSAMPAQIVAVGDIILGCRGTIAAYQRAYGRGSRYRTELGEAIPDRMSDVRRILAMVPGGKRADVIAYLRGRMGGER